jgi:hypothetical protein
MINKKQKEELLSSSFSARLSAILKTSDISVELSSEEEVTSSIKITFLEDGEEKMFLYMSKKDNIVSPASVLYEDLRTLRMRLRAGEVIQSTLTYNL